MPTSTLVRLPQQAANPIREARPGPSPARLVRGVRHARPVSGPPRAAGRRLRVWTCPETAEDVLVGYVTPQVRVAGVVPFHGAAEAPRCQQPTPPHGTATSERPIEPLAGRVIACPLPTFAGSSYAWLGWWVTSSGSAVAFLAPGRSSSPRAVWTVRGLSGCPVWARRAPSWLTVCRSPQLRRTVRTHWRDLDSAPPHEHHHRAEIIEATRYQPSRPLRLTHRTARAYRHPDQPGRKMRSRTFTATLTPRCRQARGGEGNR
jgi:hypothetical protein